MAKKNNKHKTIHLVAGTIFGIVAIVHALRLGFNLPVIFGTWEAPMWLSWLAVLLAGVLSVLLLKSSKD